MNKEPRLLVDNRELYHEAIVGAVNCLTSSTAFSEGDHMKEKFNGNEFKYYWPQQLKEIRKCRQISDAEILLELGDGFESPRPSDRPKNCLFSKKKRLYVKELSYSEMVVLKSIIGRYYEYMTQTNSSYVMHILCVVRIGQSATAASFLRRKPNPDNVYLMVCNTVFPQHLHEIVNIYLFNGTSDDSLPKLWGVKGLSSYTLEQELAMEPKERKFTLENLNNDIAFLKSINLENYAILYAITQREKEALLQLPGAPYGPEIDISIPLERRNTIPARHDVFSGAVAVSAQLIPVPLKNYEFLEREYYVGIIDILVVEDYRDRLRSAYTFENARRRSLLPVENIGDPRSSEEYATRIITFLQNKLLPNYSLVDDDDDCSAFSSFEDP